MNIIVKQLFFESKQPFRLRKNIYSKFINNLEKYVNIYNYLINRYNDSKDIKEILYRIKFGFDNKPKCEYCGKELTLDQYNKTKYCCKEHQKLGRNQKNKKTCLKLYGVEYITQVPSVIEKQIKHKIEKYGCGNNVEKIKQTCLEKYGVDNVWKVKKIQEKRKQSWIKKYGVDNPSKAKEIKEIKKEHCLEKYGETCIFKNEKYKNIIFKTNLKKYGVDNPSKSKEIKEKISFKLLSPECKEKTYLTHKKNKSFNISKPEEKYFEYLKSIYNENDILRQYTSEKYPFACDFYIISEDKYIEYQGTWTHGGHPFNPNSEDDKKLLEKWKSKNTKYYNNAIYTWTDLDVRKRKIAKENNLNFEEIWNTI